MHDSPSIGLVLGLTFGLIAVLGLLAAVWWRAMGPGRRLAALVVDEEPFRFSFVVERAQAPVLWLHSRWYGLRSELSDDTTPVHSVELELEVVARDPQAKGGYRASGERRLASGPLRPRGRMRYSTSFHGGGYVTVTRWQTLLPMPELAAGTEVEMEGRCLPENLGGYQRVELVVAKRTRAHGS
jgi:hypothetical protein